MVLFFSSSLVVVLAALVVEIAANEAVVSIGYVLRLLSVTLIINI